MKTGSKIKDFAMIGACAIGFCATAHPQILYSENFTGRAAKGYVAQTFAGKGGVSLSSPESKPTETGITVTVTPASDPYAAGLRNYYVTPHSVTDNKPADAVFTFSLAGSNVKKVLVTLMDIDPGAPDNGAYKSESFSLSSTSATYGGPLSGFTESKGSGAGTFNLNVPHYKIYFDFGTAFNEGGGTAATGSNSFSVTINDILLKTTPSSSVPAP